MSYLRKLWNQISDDWKSIFIRKFSVPALKIHQNVLFAPPTFLESIYEATHLEIEREGIKELSGLILTPNLRSLALPKNALTSLEGIQKAPHLVQLNVSKNMLTEVYPLYELRKLEVLDISHNPIRYLYALFRCPLRELYVSHNKIRSLDGLEKIENLQILDASNNYIRELKLNNFLKVKELWLSKNQIEAIDIAQGYSPFLEILDLSYNPLQKIPEVHSLGFEVLLEGVEFWDEG